MDAEVAAYRKQMKDWPQRAIRRGDAVRPLPPHARSLAELTFDGGGVRLSISDYMARRRTAGLFDDALPWRPGAARCSA